MKASPGQEAMLLATVEVGTVVSRARTVPRRCGTPSGASLPVARCSAVALRVACQASWIADFLTTCIPRESGESNNAHNILPFLIPEGNLHHRQLHRSYPHLIWRAASCA